MEFRGAVFSDINKIMIIIKQAQEYLKQEGIDQWQNNYPNPEIIKNDIENKIGYVLVYNENIIGSVAVSFDGEKTYDYIEGNWLSNNDYAVVHRTAISSEYKGQGFASIMLKNIESMCLEKGIHSIRVDTHEENLSMQRFIKKSGFQYCGIIYLQDGSKRLAYEKLI